MIRQKSFSNTIWVQSSITPSKALNWYWISFSLTFAPPSKKRKSKKNFLLICSSSIAKKEISWSRIEEKHGSHSTPLNWIICQNWIKGKKRRKKKKVFCSTKQLLDKATMSKLIIAILSSCFLVSCAGKHIHVTDKTFKRLVGLGVLH